MIAFAVEPRFGEEFVLILLAVVAYAGYLVLGAVGASTRRRTWLLAAAAGCWSVAVTVAFVFVEAGTVAGWLAFGLVVAAAVLVGLASSPVNTPTAWFEYVSGVSIAAVAVLTTAVDTAERPLGIALMLFGLSVLAAAITDLAPRWGRLRRNRVGLSVI